MLYTDSAFLRKQFQRKSLDESSSEEMENKAISSFNLKLKLEDELCNTCNASEEFVMEVREYVSARQLTFSGLDIFSDGSTASELAGYGSPLAGAQRMLNT